MEKTTYFYLTKKQKAKVMDVMLYLFFVFQIHPH